MSDTITVHFQYDSGRKATSTIYIRTIVEELRQRIANGSLLSARHRLNSLSMMHSSIATHPLVVLLGEELRLAEAVRDQQRLNELAEEIA